MCCEVLCIERVKKVPLIYMNKLGVCETPQAA